jgi:hypothetical protein
MSGKILVFWINLGYLFLYFIIINNIDLNHVLGNEPTLNLLSQCLETYKMITVAG